jgi:acetyltransferase
MHGKRFARELVLGIARDEAFGPVLAFGAGGTLVELLHDSAVALPPLNRLLAREMIDRTRVRRLLGAFRDMPPVDLDALESALLRVSELACELPEIKELDVNPLIADEHGVLAVDARVVLERSAPGRERYAHVAIQPFPSQLVRTLELQDGSRLTLRPIRPEDAQMEQRFMQKLSLQSRYFRFHQGLVELTPRMLVRFTQLDYDRELAFVALCADPTCAGEEEEIGVARYIQNPDGESCEFALVVADAWHGKHVGSHLMRALIAAARDKGLLRMQGEVLTENRKMLDLVRYLGFVVHAHPEDATVRQVELDLRGIRS